MFYFLVEAQSCIRTDVSVLFPEGLLCQPSYTASAEQMAPGDRCSLALRTSVLSASDCVLVNPGSPHAGGEHRLVTPEPGRNKHKGARFVSSRLSASDFLR